MGHFIPSMSLWVDWKPLDTETFRQIWLISRSQLCSIKTRTHGLISQFVKWLHFNETIIRHHKCCKYLHKTNSTVLTTVKRTKFHLTLTITGEINLFVHVICSSASLPAAVQAGWRTNNIAIQVNPLVCKLISGIMVLEFGSFDGGKMVSNGVGFAEISSILFVLQAIVFFEMEPLLLLFSSLVKSNWKPNKRSRKIPFLLDWS